MSHDGLYGPIFDAMVSGLDAPENVPQTVAYGLEKTVPGHLPTTGAGVPPPSLLHPATLPLVPLGPHAAGGTLRQRAAAWLVSRTGIQTTATSIGVPSLLWAVGEISAAQSELWTAGAGAVLVSGGMVLGAVSLDRKFGTGATLTGVGTFAAGFQTALSASPSVWAGFIGWLLSAAACGGARVVYANARKEPEAKVRILEGQARLVDAKVMTETYKAEARLYKARLDQLKLMQAMAAAQPQPQALPYLGGGPEESALRTAFWHGLKLELPYVAVDTTLTGWSATVALPSGTSRGQVRSGWDKVTTELGLSGQVTLSNAARGNELLVRFVDPDRAVNDTLWHPGRQGIGVNTYTGEFVDVPVEGVQSMTGGRTNMGKSAYARIQLMRTVRDPFRAGVVIDPKRAEAVAWSGKLRTAGEAADIDIRNGQVYDMLSELMAEFRHRQTLFPGLYWQASEEYPTLFVTVDEGAAVKRISEVEKLDENGRKYKPYGDALEMAETLYGEARVVGMYFNWASQYLAKGTSIPQLVKENVGAVIGLTTAGGEGDRMLFGEEAGRKGWDASELCGGIPGRALVKYLSSKPEPVQLWHVTGEHIAALPDVEPWRSRAYRGAAPTTSVPDTEPQQGGNRYLVQRYIEENPGASHREIADQTGVPRSTVQRLMRQL